MAMHLEPLSEGPSELYEPTFLTGLPDVLSSWRIAAVLIQGFVCVCVNNLWVMPNSKSKFWFSSPALILHL